jgi:hypothetical protein
MYFYIKKEINKLNFNKFKREKKTTFHGLINLKKVVLSIFFSRLFCWCHFVVDGLSSVLFEYKFWSEAFWNAFLFINKISKIIRGFQFFYQRSRKKLFKLDLQGSELYRCLIDEYWHVLLLLFLIFIFVADQLVSFYYLHFRLFIF